MESVGSYPRIVRVTSVLIALNVAVFLLWQISDPSDDGFMARNFLVSGVALREGRWWTLVTSVFSHFALLHIFLNMYVLRSFGAVMEQSLGRARFLRFYLGAGIVASLCHCLVSAYLLGQPGLPALGASGAISGVVLLFALVYPRQRLLFFGLLPAPAIWGALLFVGMDAWGLLQQVRGSGGMPIGYGAHLGGALAGLAYYLTVIRPKLSRR